MDVEELTQTIVNEYIKKNHRLCPGQIQRKRKQKVKICFNFVDDIRYSRYFRAYHHATTYEHRKRRDLQVTPFSATK